MERPYIKPAAPGNSASFAHGTIAGEGHLGRHRIEAAGDDGAKKGLEGPDRSEGFRQRPDEALRLGTDLAHYDAVALPDEFRQIQRTDPDPLHGAQ
jgi:hypothetical protein